MFTQHRSFWLLLLAVVAFHPMDTTAKLWLDTVAFTMFYFMYDVDTVKKKKKKNNTIG